MTTTQFLISKCRQQLIKNYRKRSRYYQGIIDLNMIEKGESYDILKESYVIFICTFDFFEKGRSVYEFDKA